MQLAAMVQTDMPYGWTKMPVDAALACLHQAHQQPDAGLQAYPAGYRRFSVSRVGDASVPLFTAVGLAGSAVTAEAAFPRLEALADRFNVPADLVEPNLALFGFVADDCSVPMTATGPAAVATVLDGERDMRQFIEAARDAGLLQGVSVITHGAVFARTAT